MAEVGDNQGLPAHISSKGVTQQNSEVCYPVTTAITFEPWGKNLRSVSA
jgi:hypothetical protein